VRRATLALYAIPGLVALGLFAMMLVPGAAPIELAPFVSLQLAFKTFQFN